MSLDDPFDRETQGREGYFGLRDRKRKTLEPLTTIVWRKPGTQVPVTFTYTGYNGRVQHTLDHENQLWVQGNRILKDPDAHPTTKSVIRRADRGNIFFSKTLRLVDPPRPDSYSGERFGIKETFNGYRWPCIHAYNKSRMNWDSTFEAIDANIVSELFQYGGAGIAATLPTVPESSVWRTLGELARDFPRVPGIGIKKRPTLGGAADEFLNYTFGLAPSVGDLYGLGRASVDAEKLISQFQKESNKILRRGMLLHDAENTTTTSVQNSPQYPMGYRYTDPLENKLGTCLHQVTESKRVWFSGGYSYRTPPPGLMAKLQEFNRVYGTTPSLDDAWNLLPWSWLADWFATFGNLSTNLSTLSRNDLRIHHAYVMMERKRVYKYTNFGHVVTFEETIKSRVRASPFGFGFRPGSLSDKQKAILTAIGVSRWM